MNHRLGWAVALCLVVGPTVAMAQGKSAVTPSLATIPTGGAEGSASGLEGSFLPAPATGAGTYQVTLSLPPGRADFVPPLGLVYSTRGGDGELGIGWSLSGVPRIHRDTTRAPRYLDEPLWTPREDRWLLDGVPLVPVDAAAAELVDCAGLQKSDCATRPPEVAGWQEYRPSDGAPMRVFRSADARRWLAVASDGSWQEFGVLRRGPRLAVRFSARSLQTNAAGQVFSAKLTRRSDRYGSAAYYRYLAIGGYSLLQYVDYVSPNDCGGSLSVVGAHEARQCSVPLDRYAVRVALHYEERPDQARIYRGGAERTLARRLVRLDLTSDQDGSGRMLVRRYRLTYGPDHRSMLASVQLEGRKTDDDATYGFDVGVAIPEASLTDAVAGPLFPPLTFSYTGGPSSADPEAWMGGADLSLRSLDVPPPATVSVADGDTDLFDVNADGLVDVIRSSAGTVDAYFNAYSGSQGAPAGVLRRFSQAISMPVLGAPTMLSLSDDRWHPGDTDADARSELVYVPGVGDPQGRARPRRTVPGANVTLADQGLRWEFDATATVTPAALGMATAPEAYRYVDVDADGLVDILHITASDTYVWWNLGRYPNGEGLFGRAVPGAVDPWTLQELPSERCAPVFFGAVLLSDPNARLADVNGDGIVDLTYFVDPGVAVYYGRGNGDFGDPAACGGANYDAYYPGALLGVGGSALAIEQTRITDVNGDGFADLVRAGNDVRLRLGRVAGDFDPTITAPSFGAGDDNAIRIADIDGNLAVDIVRGENDWLYVTPGGDERAGLLYRVDNGLGKVTTIEYGSAIDEYIRDRQTGTFAWDEAPLQCLETGACPDGLGSAALNTLVVKAIETTDRFGELRLNELGEPDDQVSRTEFEYHDGAFGGEERSFWGFGVTDVCKLGDASQPTSCTRSHYHQARRPVALVGARNVPNPFLGLQGKAYLVETWVPGPGVVAQYGSSVHTSYGLRTWFGLDDHPIQQVAPTQIDTFSYPGHDYADGSEVYTLPGVVAEGPNAARNGTGTDAPNRPHYDSVTSHSVSIRAASFAHTRERIVRRSNFGKVMERVRDGRLRDEGDVAEQNYGESIFERMTPVLLNDGGQWVLVEARSSTSDGTSAGRETEYRHDSLGFVVGRSQRAAHSGIPFDFGSLGTTPAMLDLVETYRRNAWGAQIETCVGEVLGSAACLRNSMLEFDSAFARFPVVHTAETGDGSLTSTATFDGGLGLVTSLTEQNGVVRTAAYDGFGRLTATFVDPAGCAAPRETFHFDMAPAGAPVSVVTSRQYSDCSGTHSESRTYVDGLQRARATLAQDVAANRWTRSGLGLLNSHGASRRSYLVSTLDAATPNLAEALELPSAPFSSTTRDGFGRVIGTTDELGHASELRHGALSEERWEPDDLEAGGPHEGTPSIRRLDGHGREREQILVRRIPGVSGDIYVRLVSQYAATGDVLRLTRLASSDGAPIPAGASAPASLIPDQRVDRVFHRDTAGRLLAVEDPSLDASGGPAGERHWRYLHNTAGDLVAVRDPRGCGENYYFDRLGRRIGEELVDCDEAVPSPLAGAELPPFAVGMGSGPSLVHTRYFFDDAPSWTSEGFAPIVGSTAGRLVAVEGPTQRVLLEHDARARVVERQVQLAGTEFAAPLGSVSSLADVPAPTELGDVVYDAARTFSMTLHYDHADRLIRRDLPSDPDWAAVGGIGPAPTIAAHAELDPRRGLLARSWVSIDGGTYNVMRSATYHPGGGLSTAHIGAVGGGLHLSYGYDDRLRPISMSATRTPTAMADPLTRPLAAVGTIGALEYEFDSAGRLTGVRDLRDPLEWPEGFQPREQIIEHDSLGRVVGIDFRYAEQFPGTFAFGAEPATDWRTAFSEQAAIDPMRPSPAPRATDLPTDRVSSLTYDYNWLATRTEWTDDQHAFFDRSLGTAVTGLEVGGRPTAVYLWSNLDATTPSDLGGFAVFDYGDSGNVVGMTVRAQCTAVAPSSCTDPGGTNLAARVGALESGCRCATEQHYRYDYGARNELMLARRYDRNGSGDWEIAARQRDLHDESKTRRIQVVEHYESGGVTTRALQSVFPGTVERRGTRWDVLEGWEGTAALGTEMQYVTAGARLVWGPGATPLGDPSPSHRLTYRVTDALGTTGAVVDLVSNEVASVATFLPTGARETLLVDDAVFPVEPQGYTGKEEDVAVGLIYFGQRYLLSGANQWASPDPADIHLVAGGEALNPYEYVGGGVLSARDPDGLAPPEPTAEGYAGLDKMLAKFELTDDTIRKEDRERGFRLRVVRESSGLTVRDVRQLIESGEVETMNIIYVHNHGPATLLTSPGKGAFPRQQIGVRLHDLDAIDRSEGGWFGMVGAGELRYRSAAEYNTFMMDRMVNRGFSFGQAQAEFEADWQGLLDLTSEAAGSLLGAATFRGPLNKGTSRSSTTGVLENSRSLLDKGKKELPWWQIIRRINAGNAERLARAREIDAIPVGSLRRRFRQEVARPREE